MIKCNIKKGPGGKVKVKANGNPSELCTECSALISVIYDAIKKESIAAAGEFRRTLVGTLITPGSPVWDLDKKEGK